MTDYNRYVTAINKIFECTNTMKTAWSSPDNLNYLEKIEEFRNSVVEHAKDIEQISKSSNKEVEELGQ